MRVQNGGRGGFNRSVDPERIIEIRNTAGSVYSPISTLEPTREWVGFRPGSECQGATIGRVPGTNVWLAYGHYRNGILLTPATAHLVSRQILSASYKSQEVDSVALASMPFI